MQGDAALFARSDEIELAWQLIDPLTADVPPEVYEPGGQGPTKADAFLAQEGRTWVPIPAQDGAGEGSIL
jgi:glucose-6-phosphate 1-dehydrogenase